MAVSLNMDIDAHLIERNLFTTLDILAAIGGLASIFTSAIAFVVNIWHWHGLADMFLVSNLFTLSSVMSVTHSR